MAELTARAGMRHRPLRMEDVYRLRIGVIWQQLLREPLYFWLFCGYLFFEYFRPQGIFPVIDVFPWARALIISAFLTFLFFARESRSLSSPLTFPLFAFYIVVFASMAFAQFPGASLDEINVLFSWLLAYILFLWIVDSKFRFFIVALLIFLASLKLAQHGFRVSLSRGFSFASWGIQGPPGFFRNAADLGTQMAIFTPLAVAFYFGCRPYVTSRFVRALFLFAPVAAIATAVGTGNRTTAVAFAAMGLTLVLFVKNKLRNLALLGLVGAAVLMVVPDEFKERFESAGTDSTSVSRLLYWERGIDFFKQYPVTGIGYNNWVPYYVSRYPEEAIRYGRAEVAHSVPITLAAETGVFGLFFYYLLVMMMVIVNVRSARMFKQDAAPLWRNFALALNFGLVGFLTASVFLSIAFYPFLWIQAGLSAALYRVALKEQGIRAHRRGWQTPNAADGR